MGRPPRIAVGGIVYHVLNRANGRARIFEDDADCLSFQDVLLEARQRVNMRILAFCIMPTHWHVVVWPRANGDLSSFGAWLTLTHTQRWHAAHGTAGQGHVYQGRFKSFPVEQDLHLLTLNRYVEANARRAGLVRRAESWRWSSAWIRMHQRDLARELLDDWPVPIPRHWLQLLNQPLPAREADAIRESLVRSRPFGQEAWVKRTAATLQLQSTLRGPGRPPRETVSDTGV